MRTLISVAVLAFALAACGDGDDASADNSSSPSSATRSTPSQSPTSDNSTPSVDSPEMTEYGPTCESVFVEGATMPQEAADGCYDEAGDTISASFTTDCADGRVFVHNPLGYGIVGKEVHLPAPGEDEPDVNSAGYQAILEDCEG